MHLPASQTRKKKGPGRPLTPLITRETAIQVSIDLLDRKGLDALTVQAVARELGVQAPSLYYHFKNRDELLHMIARTLLVEVGRGERPGATWEERVVDLAVATRRVMLNHAHAGPLMLRFFPRELMLGAYERGLSDCPYPPEHHLAVLEALEKLTYGKSLFDAAAKAHDHAAMPPVDAARYPLLAAALARTSVTDEALFVETLQVLLDGFKFRYGKGTVQ
jgi:TetR/AcrR family transcriptional regulator, tetracycline repressor protein